MSISAEQMIINIGATMAPIANLLVAGAYIMGLLMIAQAVFKFRRLTDRQAMMQQHEFLPPFIYLIMGAGLIWLPQLFEATSNTLFGEDAASVLSYSTVASNNRDVVDALLKVMAVIGLIAFIRGVNIIAKASEGQHSQSGSVGKGLTHVIGGVLCYHIDIWYQVILNTLGI